MTVVLVTSVLFAEWIDFSHAMKYTVHHCTQKMAKKTQHHTNFYKSANNGHIHSKKKQELFT